MSRYRGWLAEKAKGQGVMHDEYKYTPPRRRTMQPNDLTVDDLIEQMERILQNNPNAQLYVKWTCPNCGERVASEEPNTFRTGGYLHDEPHCGYLYKGDRYGFMAVFSAKEAANGAHT